MEALITRVGSSLLTSLLRPALVAASARLAGPALRSAASLRSHSTDGEMPTFDAAHTRRVNQMLAAKDTLIPEEAAAVLTSHWGAPVLPGQVLSDLTASQLAATLETAHPVGTGNINVDDGHLLRSALYMHAESVSTRFFGDKVFQRGKAYRGNKPVTLILCTQRVLLLLLSAHQVIPSLPPSYPVQFPC